MGRPSVRFCGHHCEWLRVKTCPGPFSSHFVDGLRQPPAGGCRAVPLCCPRSSGRRPHLDRAACTRSSWCPPAGRSAPPGQGHVLRRLGHFLDRVVDPQPIDGQRLLPRKSPIPLFRSAKWGSVRKKTHGLPDSHLARRWPSSDSCAGTSGRRNRQCGRASPSCSLACAKHGKTAARSESTMPPTL